MQSAAFYFWKHSQEQCQSSPKYSPLDRHLKVRVSRSLLFSHNKRVKVCCVLHEAVKISIKMCLWPLKYRLFFLDSQKMLHNYFFLVHIDTSLVLIGLTYIYLFRDGC